MHNPVLDQQSDQLGITTVNIIETDLPLKLFDKIWAETMPSNQIVL